MSTYRKKRDFEKTAEPSGDVKVAPSKQRRFVIQKHDATPAALRSPAGIRRRLQILGGDQGPSLDPHDKRLAVEVEDHPLDYGDFEGTIPEGPVWRRHGACCGTAAIWESDDPERGFKKGDLKFTLHGDKLHGSWVLVRMRDDRNGGKRTNWLLIKHRDEFAKEGEANDILEEDRSVASGRAMDADRRRQGQGAKAVHAGEAARRKADAVWHSNRGDAAEARADGKRQRCAPRRRPKPRASASAKAEEGRGDAGFRRAAALHLGRAAAERRTAGAMRSSSTATACNCGSRMARPR